MRREVRGRASRGRGGGEGHGEGEGEGRSQEAGGLEDMHVTLASVTMFYHIKRPSQRACEGPGGGSYLRATPVFWPKQEATWTRL